LIAGFCVDVDAKKAARDRGFSVVDRVTQAAFPAEIPCVVELSTLKV
jgi:hypothetical protein